MARSQAQWFVWVAALCAVLWAEGGEAMFEEEAGLFDWSEFAPLPLKPAASFVRPPAPAAPHPPPGCA